MMTIRESYGLNIQFEIVFIHTYPFCICLKSWSTPKSVSDPQYRFPSNDISVKILDKERGNRRPLPIYKKSG